MTGRLRWPSFRRGRSVPVSAVVVVTDDNALFLDECLASLEGQTTAPHEIVRVSSFQEGVQQVHGERFVLLTAGDVLDADAIRALGRPRREVVGSQGPVGAGIAAFDTRFWRAHGIAIEDGPWDHYQPQVDAVLAGARVVRTDEPVRRGVRRGTGLGFASLPQLAPHVAGFAAVVRRGLQIEGFGEWVLATEVPRFLTDAESCTPEQWALLRDLVRELVTPDALSRLPVEARVQAYLAVQDRQLDLARFNAARWQEEWYPTRNERGRTYAELPVDDVPPDVLRVEADEAPNQSGPRAEQHALQEWYADLEAPVDQELVYFQSYQGAVTDSPAAIHAELRRQRPELRTLWAVTSVETPLPEGAEPVLMRSREWYRALATAGALVVNVDLDRWFRKRPGQRVLQTYHGHPSKAMGLSAWRAKGFTPLRIERHLRRTSGTWDLLLTPSPEMDAHYREQYQYDGPILAAGYPRDDVLVGTDAERIRRETRELLGIGDRTAVLYAPTWRDDLATNFREAPLALALDVERAAAELGDGYVLLLRGHRFHRRRPELSSRLLDVTDHPEVNELILAADAAVLDYSSLRFDFSLTGRPMVFLVPDLERYSSRSRAFLFDFRASAPGPLVDGTDAVVAALRDLDGIADRYRDEYARFSSTYNRLQDGHAAERVVSAFFGDAGAAETLP